MSVPVNYTIAGNEARMQTASGVFLGPLATLAQQRKTWTPGLLAGVLWRALTNIGRQHEIFKLLKLPDFEALIQTDPRFALKYLTHDYLSRGFSVSERAACFVHHYKRLHAKLPGALLRKILYRDISLFDADEDGHRLGIALSLSRPKDHVGNHSVEIQHDKEGELSLYLRVDRDIVFVLSFTIVPGRVVKSEAADVLLITRLQGAKGYFRQIHIATKALHDVAPGAMLVAALQGIAEPLGIGEIACIRGADQSSYCDKWEHSFKTAYDDFWADLGVELNTANFFVSSVPIQEKPLASIKQGHKLRTREKRIFKRQVAEEVSNLLRELCQGEQHAIPELHSAPAPAILGHRSAQVLES